MAVSLAGGFMSRRRWQGTALGALVASLVSASPCLAQTGRGTFWAKLSGGYGSTSSSGVYQGGPTGSPENDGITGGSNGAISAALHVGESVSRSLRLGGGIRFNWVKGGSDPTITDVQAIGFYYLPRPGKKAPSPVSLSLAVGTSHYHSRTFVCNGAPTPGCPLVSSAPATGDGWSLAVGLGCDLHLAHGAYLTPTVRYSMVNIGDIVIPGAAPIATDWKQHVFTFGVSLGYH